MSQTPRVASLDIFSNTSAPIASGRRGLWANGDVLYFRKSDGSDTNLTTGGGGGGGSGAGWVRSAAADTSPTAAPTASAPVHVAYTSITAPRTVTGTTAGSATAPVYLIISDESGSITATNKVTFAPSSGTIDGSATKDVLTAGRSWWMGYCNGTNWFSIDGENNVKMVSPTINGIIGTGANAIAFGTSSGQITFPSGGMGNDLAIATDNSYVIGDSTHRLNKLWTTRLGGGSSNTLGHLVPNVADDTLTLNAATQTLTNKTVASPVWSGTATGTYTLGGTPTVGASIAVGSSTVYSLGDSTHLMATVWSNRIGGGNVNTSGHIIPNVADDTVALTSASQSLANKTLPSPVLSGTATGTYTLAGTPTIGASLAIGTDNSFNVGDNTHRYAQLWTTKIGGGASNTSGHSVPNAADSTFALLGVTQTFTKAQGAASVALTDAVNISTDASLSNSFTVTLAGNRTLDNPTNLVAGFTYVWVITQDATGSRTLAYGTKFKWPGGSTPVLTTTANAVDMISAYYNGTNLLCAFAADIK